jgi:hypothetical protein
MGCWLSHHEGTEVSNAGDVLSGPADPLKRLPCGWLEDAPFVEQGVPHDLLVGESLWRLKPVWPKLPKHCDVLDDP